MKQINDIADQKAVDEVKTLLQKARTANIKANQAQRIAWEAIENMCIDIDTPSKAENADTFEDAINCYIQYGEFGIKNLMREIRIQIETTK
jgi:hypothetical protein